MVFLKEKLLAAATLTALVASHTPVAIGATTAATEPHSSGATLVWVAKDVTRAFNYRTEFKTYNQSGQLVHDQTVVPPAGSLVEYVQEPLATAMAGHEDFVLAEPGQDATQMEGTLEQLHLKLFQALNDGQVPDELLPDSPSSPADNAASGSILASASSPNTGPGTRTTASSSFTNYAGVSWNYTIYYNTFNYPYLKCTEETIFQSGAGTPSSLDHAAWDGYTSYFGDIPVSRDIATPTVESLAWQGSAGYTFTTYVICGGATYSGYSTLN